MNFLETPPSISVLLKLFLPSRSFLLLYFTKNSTWVLKIIFLWLHKWLHVLNLEIEKSKKKAKVTTILSPRMNYSKHFHAFSSSLGFYIYLSVISLM